MATGPPRAGDPRALAPGQSARDRPLAAGPSGAGARDRRSDKLIRSAPASTAPSDASAGR